MDGTDACVGMTVQFRHGFGTPPCAGIITAVGIDRVSVSVFTDGQAQPDLRTGVMHSSHPGARRNLEVNDDAGVWDYVERQPPAEIDKSKGKTTKERPQKTARPPSAMRDVVSSS